MTKVNPIILSRFSNRKEVCAVRPVRKSTIEAARKRNLNKLTDIPGVVRVADIKRDSRGEFIPVLVNIPLKELKGVIPTNLDGYRVKVEQVNKPVRKRAKNK